VSAITESPRTTAPTEDAKTLERLDARLRELRDEIARLSAAREILLSPLAPAGAPELEATSDDAVEEAIVRSSVLAEPTDMARFLQTHLGQQLTAYLAGLRDPKTVGQWVRGKAKPPALTRERLRVAYAAARLLTNVYGDDAARGWFFGANSSLDDRAPASVLRDSGTPDELATIIPLARAFVRGAH